MSVIVAAAGAVADPLRSRQQTWVVAATVGLVALAARWTRIQASYEVHIDETSYVEVASRLAGGDGLSIYGEPFHLHPPGWFVVLAAAIRLLGLPGGQPGRLELIEALRPVEALVGVATCVVLSLLVVRLAGRAGGAAAGLYLALDPFAVRFDSRVFLEAPAMLMAVVAISLTAAAAQGARARGAPSGAPRGRLLVAAGLAAGASVLTKDTYAFLTVLPLSILLLSGVALRRRDSATILGVALACYASYVVGIIATGQWAPWWAEKGSGVSRLVGVEQSTGFNAPGSVPIAAQLRERLIDFGPTYLVLALGAVSIVLLAHRSGRAVLSGRGRAGTAGIAAPPGAHVVVLVWAACAYAYVAYAVLVGTLEEQTFYLALAPGLTVASIELAGIASRHGSARGAVAALAGLCVISAAVVWTSVHTSRDDGYHQLQAWASRELPRGTRVAVTEDTGQFILKDLQLTDEGSPRQLAADRIPYVLVSTTLVERGYGSVTEQSLKVIESRGTEVFCVKGRTAGELRLYDVRALYGGDAVRLSPTSRVEC